LMGLVTDRDLVIRGLAAGGDPARARIGGIASRATATVGPDDSLDRAAQIMRERSVRRLPVIEDGRPVGIVSIRDLAAEEDARSRPASGMADANANANSSANSSASAARPNA
ncbi:MAG: CBS domain-containing protein, partial [Spirillospora sp.]